MRLDASHIGKKVRRVGESPTEGVLIAVMEAPQRYVVEIGVDDERVYWFDNYTLGYWEVVEPGYSLLDAIESGKPFRPIGGRWSDGSEGGEDWMQARSDGTVSNVKDDGTLTTDKIVLTQRYELKPDIKTVTITAEGYDAAYDRCIEIWGEHGEPFYQLLKKELGL